MTEKEINDRKKTLETSYKMHLDSIKEVTEVRNTKRNNEGNLVYGDPEKTEEIKTLMGNALQPIISEYMNLGGTKEELDAKAKAVDDNKAYRKAMLEQIIRNEERDEEKARMREQIEVMMKKKEEERVRKEAEYNSITQGANTTTETNIVVQKPVEAIPVIANEEMSTYTVNTQYGTMGIQSYEEVKLPSRGEGYRNKIDRLPIAYMTANDENLIVSPNLYKDGTFLDYIIANKIMNNSISVDDLLLGDRDAIILWLRGSSYGTMFPVTATDNVTGEQFETEIDLEQLKHKPFTLKGDENGYFDFEMPVRKDKIKFRFLTVGDMRALEKAESYENMGIRKGNIDDMVKRIRELMELDGEMDNKTRAKMLNAVETLNTYNDGIVEKKNYYTHTITNKMLRNIVSVNGITDKKYIVDYVNNMNIKDANALRSYINENAPGIDFNIEVEKPESLGGGSMRTFLSIDQYVFLNRSENLR